jgi:S1-C subfamily serine protease
MYAVRALEERFPSVGFEGTEVTLPGGADAIAPEQVAIRVDQVDAGSAARRAGLLPGDILISFGGEPFFRDRGGVSGLHHWLVRELRTYDQAYELVAWREGTLLTLISSFSLGPYRP